MKWATNISPTGQLNIRSISTTPLYVQDNKTLQTVIKTLTNNKKKLRIINQFINTHM